nr:hypothetical protein [Tanacetum cinerariifolium]GFA24389.1 hypothetical protein [Tanacetum cinerariifolium]
MEAIIRDALRLADAEGINCLPNEEIFTELARMGTASVNDDDIHVVVDEPSILSPTPYTQPPSTSQDIPSTSQVQPTPPPSLTAQPPLPQQQPHSSQDAGISMDLLQNLLDTCTTC